MATGYNMIYSMHGIIIDNIAMDWFVAILSMVL